MINITYINSRKFNFTDLGKHRTLNQVNINTLPLLQKARF